MSWGRTTRILTAVALAGAALPALVAGQIVTATEASAAPIATNAVATIAVATIAVATSAVATGTTANPVPAAITAAATTPQTPVQQAVSTFGGCLTGGGSGDLLLLVDDSGSLQQSDPNDARVTAAQYLIRQLTSFSQSSGTSIDMKVASFSTTYETGSSWTKLSSSSESQVGSTIAGLKSKDDGLETDYWSALEGARQDLATQASTRQAGTSCQAIAWFTDGQLDYVPRTTSSLVKEYGTTKPFAPGDDMSTAAGAAAVKAAAQQQLCRAGGLADQLRSSKVTMFAIGLESSSASASDFSLLDSIATGSDSTSGTTCGDVKYPGAFALASNISDLLFAFDAISTPGQSPLEQTSGICQVTYCTDQFHKFVLDTSTPRVHILAAADIDKVDVDLVGPDGKQVRLPNNGVGTTSTASVSGGTASYTWESDDTVAVDLTESNGSTAWTGLWKVVFIDPTGQSTGKTSRTNIHISSDYRPSWSDAKTARVHIGESFPGTLGITGTGGSAVAGSSILGTVGLDATLTDSAGKTATITSGLTKTQLDQPVATKVDGLTSGSGTLTLTLDLTTAPVTSGGVVTEPGTVLEPSVVRLPVVIAPPSQYPVVAGNLDFGTLDGTTSATAQLAVSRSGCVWLPAGSAHVDAAPSDIGTLTLAASSADSKTHCATASSSSTVPVTITFDKADNGSINGTVVVKIASKDATDPVLNTTVAFTADVRKPLNTTDFLVVLIVALLLGPGIPLGLLYLAKWFTGRIPSRGLLSQRIPIEVVDGQVLRNGLPFALEATDLRELNGIPKGGVRSMVVSGTSLKVRLGGSPFGTAAVVASEPGTVSASDGVPASVGTPAAARLPLAVHNHWAVFWTPGSAPTRAEVLLLASGDASQEKKQVLVDDLLGRLPRVLAALVADTGGSSSAPSGGFASVGATSTLTDAGFGFGFDGSSSTGPGAVSPTAAPSRRPGRRLRPASNDAPAPSAPESTPGQQPDQGFGFGFGFEDPTNGSDK